MAGPFGSVRPATFTRCIVRFKFIIFRIDFDENLPESNFHEISNFMENVKCFINLLSFYKFPDIGKVQGQKTSEFRAEWDTVIRALPVLPPGG